MSEKTVDPASMHTSIPYIVGFGSAVGLIIAIISGLQIFSNFKIVDAQAYVSMREIEKKYYSKEFVASNYLSRVDVLEGYIKKSELEKSYISLDKVKSDFVSVDQFDAQQKEKRALLEVLSGIPSPFKPIVKMLSSSGQWNDPQLGLNISVKRISSLGDGSFYAGFLLALPDSPLHEEGFYSTEISRSKWTFRKSGRNFELKVDKFNPLTFSVKEV
ncbi:hypothetical protein [Pseudomonas fluorescens]|uniref:Uncharacterized protein n=1 Tax=Pseudomonas fluorescens TaxID=294 RepID=A0A5E7P2Z1_PSEFL|nr:hypothetical protein [Pseudomonas fluorescens]VVP43438.1 hypothetical protein PS880_04967 [Pseudomonas fluorescens]